MKPVLALLPPDHIPESVYGLCNGILQSIANNIAFGIGLPEEKALERLILDDSIMPKIWAELESTGKSWKFFSLINNLVSTWGMVDKMPLSEQATYLKKCRKALDSLINSLWPSSENQFYMQMMFESGLRATLKQPHYAHITFSVGKAGFVKGQNIQLLDLLIHLREQADENAAAFAAQPSGTSVFPRKKQGASALKTFFARCLVMAMHECFGKKRYEEVAQILTVILDDDSIDTDTVRKACSKLKLS